MQIVSEEGLLSAAAHVHDLHLHEEQAGPGSMVISTLLKTVVRVSSLQRWQICSHLTLHGCAAGLVQKIPAWS